MKYILTILLTLVLNILSAQVLTTHTTAKKPNILFIIADDMVYDALGHMSKGYVKTPNLSKLADEGVSFRQAYNMGAWGGAVCVSSRSQLNTGLALWHTRKLIDEHKAPPISWSQRLQKAGYDTYMTGKWHVKLYKAEKVFNTQGNVRPGMPKTTGKDKNRPVEGKPDTWNSADKSLGGYWGEDGIHWSKITANNTIDYLNSRANAKDGKPFFAYIGFNAPHDPRQAPQEYLDLYPSDKMPLPPAFMSSYPYTKEIGIWNVRGEYLAPRPRTEYAIKTHRREYYGMITHMDAQIGRIFDHLKSLGMADNTYVVFTADHGLSLGNHSFFCKQSMYDHSLSAPFIMAGPNLPKGTMSNQRIYIQDVVPTTLDWADANKDGVEFKSIQVDTKGQLTTPEQPIYGAYREFSRCVISDGWKMMIYPKVKPAVIRLYDMKKDPYELNDVASLPKHSKRIKSLFEVLKKQQQKMGDKLDLDFVFNK